MFLAEIQSVSGVGKALWWKNKKLKVCFDETLGTEKLEVD